MDLRSIIAGIAGLAARYPGLTAVAEADLRALVDAARAAWPGVTVDDATFLAYLAERLPASGDLAAMHATDLYLACGCARGDRQALAAFERAQLARIDGAVAKIGSAPDFLDEVRQRLRERLLVGDTPRIAGYSGSGALSGWVRIAATRVAITLVRESPVGAASAADPRSAADPERDVIRGQHRGALEAAFRAAFARLDREGRALLRLHYLKGISLDEIGRRRHVDRSTASRRLASVRRELMALTRRELAQRVPAMSSTSRDSLMVGLRTQLDLNLESLLGR